MKDKTKKLKELMWNHKEQYDRVGVLKDAFKGETAYICTSGPTFNQFSTDKLNELLKDELVLSIKQTQHFIDNVTDFHLLNFCKMMHIPLLLHLFDHGSITVYLYLLLHIHDLLF